MVAGLRLLLTQILDYAGLFPPAGLPLDQAIRNYATYRTCAEAWMLGRFICPASRLAELAPFVPGLSSGGEPLAISALGRGGARASEFLTGLGADLDAIAAFRQAHGSRVRVEVLEVRLPAEAYEPGAGQFFASAQEQIERLGGLQLFYEPVFAADWRSRLTELFARLRGGVKIRCGGAEPRAFPTPEQLAFVLAHCRDRGLPFKATAGLHHPLRRRDAQLQVAMHGFLNLFVAGVLARTHTPSGEPFTEQHLREVLEEENARSFSFDDSGLSWKSHRAPRELIAEVRRHAVTSFGSCSFDEPRDDLRALGLL